jgi:Zn-dependent protease
VAARTSIRWQEISGIQLMADNVILGSRAIGLRFVQVRTPDGRAIRFADLGSIGRRWVGTRAGIVSDVAQSGLLLALIADRTRTSVLFPSQWLDAPTAKVVWAGPTEMPDARIGAPAAPMVVPVDEPSPTPLATGPGERAAVAKDRTLPPSIGRQIGKLGALLAVGLKAIKPGTAVLAFAAYGLVFSWQFAAMIVVLIGFHECGHVYAMWRCGVPVRGIYFIPFLGGAAVSQGLAKTRWGNAFIQINGPIYGTFLALVSLVAYYATGGHQVFWAVMAAWGALINLFNLLPIMPLDGGRLLGEVSHSLHGTAGRFAVLGSLLLGAVIAYLADLTLLWIIVVVGALEFGRQLTAATRRALMDSLGQGRPMSYEVDEHFSSLARPLTQPLSERRRDQLKQQFDMLLTEARLVPMTGRQAGLLVVGYVLLAVILVGVLWAVNHIPGADHAFNLLK